MNYPATKKIPFSEEIGGWTNCDPYVWLEQKDDPEVRAWVAEQNETTARFFDAFPVAQRAAALRAATPNVQYQSPRPAFDRIYAIRTDIHGDSEAVILDANWQLLREVGKTLWEQMRPFSMAPCPTDARYVCLSAARRGAHVMTAIVFDLDEDRIVFDCDDVISVEWADDGSLWYSQTLPNQKEGYNENPVWRWTLEKGAVCIYRAPRDRTFIMLKPATDGVMALSVGFDFGRNELLLAGADGNVRSLTGEKKAKHDFCGMREADVYILTDDGASMGKVTCGERTVIPEKRTRMLTDVFVTAQGLLVSYMENVNAGMAIYDFEGRLQRELQLPDPLGAITMNSLHLELDGTVWFGFESFTLPPATYRLNCETGDIEKVYSAFPIPEPMDIRVQQIFVPARDGERIPAYLVSSPDAVLNGENPTLMYGYGGYNISTQPWFNNPFVGLDIRDWIARGGVYVHCNMRGGNEYGSRWHEAGMLKNKKNAFYDFIDIAEWLIANGWTRPEKLGICGGSNGGLLMTALTTMRPDLWGCVIASVPHTDMLRFVNDPAGPRYITEYGNPRDPEMLPYMRSYSPYHNVREERYPPIYIQTGEQDNNVPPYHGKKFAAKMQELSVGGPVLLRVLAEGSHDRGSGEAMYRTTAEMQLFLEHYLGMTSA